MLHALWAKLLPDICCGFLMAVVVHPVGTARGTVDSVV